MKDSINQRSSKQNFEFSNEKQTYYYLASNRQFSFTYIFHFFYKLISYFSEWKQMNYMNSFDENSLTNN